MVLLHDLQKTITGTTKLRDSTYLVTEDLKNIGDFFCRYGHWSMLVFQRL